jgi:excisionase family DNA binding protein
MGKHQQLDRKVLTLAELCDYLRIHKTTAYRLVKRGKIPAFRIGSYWRFNIEAIDKWRGVLDE